MVSGDATPASPMYSFPQWYPLNQQQSTSTMMNCHRVQINRRKQRRKRKKSCFCYSSDATSRSSICSTIIALLFFLILIVVVTIAAFAIYMGMEIILDGSLRVTYGDSYTAELSNTSSQIFFSKTHTYKIMIEKVFARSILGPSVKQCIVMGFKNGSLIIFYRLILDRRKISSRINVEETVKKILHDDITSLKPLVFTNIRLDPRQIVVKKHTLNADSHPDTETESDADLVAEEAVILNTNPSAGSKRMPHTTPSIVRKKSPTTASTTSTAAARVRSTKKQPQLTVEKNTKIKLQLDSKRANPTTSASPKKYPNVAINNNANRYSFVSEDDDGQQVGIPATASSTSQMQGLGEAEVLIIPATADESHPDEQTTQALPSPGRIPAPEVAKNAATIPNIVEAALPSQRLRPNQSVAALEKYQIDDDNNSSEKGKSDTYRNYISLLPTRSNVALNKPLRPKPTIEASGLFSTSTTASAISKPGSIGALQPTAEEEIIDSGTDMPAATLDPTTEDAAIVLNTEVVTSTSMQVSYGQHSGMAHEEDQPQADASEEDEFSVVGHNIPLGLQQPSHESGQYKYKNIFPRSIRAKRQDLLHLSNQSVKTSSGSGQTSLLTSIIEKYKKQPSNETLYLIIEQLASLYTKSTPQYSSGLGSGLGLGLGLVAGSSKSAYSGLLMTRPMNKILTTTSVAIKSTTAPVTNSEIDCGNNSTRMCLNGQCISQHLWCNQFADCKDGSDEKSCTCADYLRAQFSFEKICDGIVDCWDFSDENQCEWCSPGKHVCTNAKLCIKADQVCDGNSDCPLGDDEKNCITITQFQNDTSNRTDFVYQSIGVITVKRAGIWGKLCYKREKNDSVEETFNKLNELGKAVCKIMTFRNFVNISVVHDSDEDKLQTAVYYKLTDVIRNSTNLFRRKSFRFTKTHCDTNEVIQVSCDEMQCGIQTQIGKGRAYGKYRGERRSRIVGGGSATLGAWPWQAALYKEGEFQCGATLITNRWLLSAGHCFHNALRDYWVARLGILRRSSTLPSPHEQIRAVHRVIVHPHYTEADFINDISLLELSSPVFITNFVRPICLPSANSLLTDGILCTVIGWGRMMESGSVYPDTLQEVQLPVMSPGECRKRTLFLPLYKITDGMLCAGFDRGGRDACLGDSGGPLMCREGDGPWHLHGVTSNGNGCARAHRPGVYTKVSNYLNWIDSHIENTAATAAAAVKMTGATCNGFRCPLGECLPKARICNGYLECSDGSDEFAC